MIKTISEHNLYWDNKANRLIEEDWQLTHFAVVGNGNYYVGVFEKGQDS